MEEDIELIPANEPLNVVRWTTKEEGKQMITRIKALENSGPGEGGSGVQPKEVFESFPFSTNEGAQSIDAGCIGFAFKNDFERQITRVCSFVQANHTSGSFQFAVYKASDRTLVIQTVLRLFGDFPVGEIYADFDETVILEANTMYYMFMFINHTASRYLMAKRFRTELSGTGDFVNNTGVFQSIVQGTDYEPNAILSSISRTFPNANQIDVPYIKIL